MSQNDYVIANQSAPDFRSDLNDALQALASLSSGSSAPSTTYANMLWYDTSNNILKMRSEADDAWIDIGTLNQSTNEFEVANLTELTQTQVEDDTDTTFGLVSGERLAEAVAANAPEAGGLTLLGTLTTTSGTARTLSGLDLTGYKFLKFTVDGVGNSSGTDEALELEGVTISDGCRSTQVIRGIGEVDISAGVLTSVIHEAALPSSDSYSGSISISNASTSLSFTWSSSGSFDEGEIKIYGMK